MEDSPSREIIRRIRERGRITFEEFMEVSLYSPNRGYYMSPVGVTRKTWGRSGDYMTNLDISPVFGALLAKQIQQMWRMLGSPSDFHVVEAGSGRGYLIEQILRTAAERYHGLSLVLSASMVERNPAAFSRSKKYLEETLGVSFYEDIEEIEPFTGVIISNELMDSIAFHRMVQRSDGLKEIYVGYENNRFVDVEDTPSTERLAGYFQWVGAELPIDGRGEVSLGATDWLRRAADRLKRGFIITIDYGMPAKILFTERRNGTLLCYYRHTINDNPYLNIGMQDITAHVDFTAIKRAGEGSGLKPMGFTAQRNFLLGLGILDELKEVFTPTLKDCERLSYNQGIKDLVMPGGIGDAMKVFVQGKGVDEAGLDGFSFGDMKKTL